MKENDEKKTNIFLKEFDNLKNIGYHTAIMEQKTFTPLHTPLEYLKLLKYELFISGLGPNLSGELIKLRRKI
jgi:hypothetical protein